MVPCGETIGGTDAVQLAKAGSCPPVKEIPADTVQ